MSALNLDLDAAKAPDRHEAATQAPEPIDAEPTQPDSRKLRDDEFSCHDCGIGLVVADPAAIVTIGSSRQVDGRAIELRFTQCPECREITGLARQVIAGQPSIEASLGPAAAVHRLNCGLLALDAVGRPLPDADKLVADRSEVLRLIRHLGAVGAAVKAVSRYAPVLSAPLGSCSTSRWSHLREPELAEILPAARTAFAALLADKLVASRQDGPVTVDIPAGAPDPDLAGGCLLCGVATLLVDPAEVAALGGADAARGLAWRATTVSSPSVLGGPPSPDPIRGWICITCDEGVGTAGAVGMGSMVIALRKHLRATGRDADASKLADDPRQRLVGLAGWAGWVLRERRAGRPVPGPNTQPWDHIEVG